MGTLLSDAFLADFSRVMRSAAKVKVDWPQGATDHAIPRPAALREIERRERARRARMRLALDGLDTEAVENMAQALKGTKLSADDWSKLEQVLKTQASEKEEPAEPAPAARDATGPMDTLRMLAKKLSAPDWADLQAVLAEEGEQAGDDLPVNGANSPDGRPRNAIESGRAQDQRLAHDHRARAAFDEMFPEAARIKVLPNYGLQPGPARPQRPQPMSAAQRASFDAMFPEMSRIKHV